MNKPKLTPAYNSDLVSSSRRVFLKQSSYLGLGSVAIAHSLGIASLLNVQPAIAADDDFKALVFIFLAGGNDAFNMIPPKGDGPLRTRYEISRGAVALPADQLHSLTPQNTAKIDGDDEYNAFGMHPGCGDMAEMFNNQDMSVIFNMGNLYEPTTVAQMEAKSVSLPPQLYSHADQQRQPQSSFTHS